MCRRCFDELTGGRPPAPTPAVRAASRLVKQVYDSDWGGTGGPLHVIVEDMNLGDRFFASTDSMMEARRRHCPEADEDLCVRTFHALASLSQAERAVAVWEYQELGSTDDG